MVSLPTYDNNLFARGISNKAFSKLVKNKDLPLLNHAVQAHYPPGSTYKLVAGTGGLADRKISATTLVADEGLPDDRGDASTTTGTTRGFGPATSTAGSATRATRTSSRSAGMLGIDRLGYWAKQYGFGAPTGIDLPGRGVRHRPDQRVEAGHARRPDLPRRDVPGEHRPGLRRGHPDPADQRLHRARQRGQAVPATGRARGHRSRWHGRPAVQADASSTS